jgi:hypothetical protein
MIGHMEKVRAFKPTNGPGGSKKGKSNARWPLFLKVVADAVVIAHKGSIDAALADRNYISPAALKARLEQLLPGLEQYIAERPSKDPYAQLKNRVYKMYYSGTSDRGRDHDPRTRAAMSREHWRNQVPAADELALLHDKVMRGSVATIKDWRSRL